MNGAHQNDVETHLTAQDVETYSERRMTAAALLRAEQHLAQCPACRSLLAESADAAPSILDLLNGIIQEETEHIEDDLLDDYARGRADGVDRIIVESHLDGCAYCRALVRDIRENAAREGTTTRRHAAAGATAATPYAVRYSRVTKICFATAAALILATVTTVHLEGRLASQRIAEQRLDDRIAQLRLQQAEDANRIAQLQEKLRAAAPVQVASAQFNTDDSMVQGIMTGRMLAQLSTTDASVRGGQAVDAARLISPVATVVSVDRPVLRWQPLNGSANYSVLVMDTDSNEVHGRTSVNTWQPLAPLTPGKVYVWYVTPSNTSSQPISRIARFSTLPLESRAPLAAELKNAGSSPEARARVDIRYGLLDDAAAELRSSRGPDAERLRHDVALLTQQ